MTNQPQSYASALTKIRHQENKRTNALILALLGHGLDDIAMTYHIGREGKRSDDLILLRECSCSITCRRNAETAKLEADAIRRTVSRIG